MILKKVKKWLDSLRYYVILDPKDNSVTLSKALFKHMKKNAKGEGANVFVFKIKHNDNYAFMVNPNLEQPTQLCEIQYNDKYKCIGFETLCPSVGKILYDYGMPDSQILKMSVSVQLTNGEEPAIYYQIDKQNKNND